MRQKYRECPSYRVRRGALVHGAELPGGVNPKSSADTTRARALCARERGGARHRETCDDLVFKKE